MAAYNAELFIEQSILSVISQTYTNWEFLIINDCSNDKTLDIINKYYAIDKRIKIYNTENNTNNPSIPRNIGIENASGQYIAFIDSDDIWYSKKLEQQLNFMLIHDINFSYTNFDFIDINGLIIENRLNINKKLSYRKLLTCNYIACSTVMYNICFFGKIKFNTEINRGEDFLLWLSFLRKEKYAYLIDRKLTFYRKRNNSTSKNKILTLKNIMKIYKDQLSYNWLLTFTLTILFCTKTLIKKYEF